MFYPDGRVFMCMMFIDLPSSHSFVWTMDGLKENKSLASEREVVKRKGRVSCPAMRYVNGRIEQEAVDNNQFIHCIYAKERLNALVKYPHEHLPCCALNYTLVRGYR